jgi:uncharacterized protein YbaP (TraB family)
MTMHAKRGALALRSVAAAIVLLLTVQAAQAKTFAWKVTGHGGVVYLVGSVHMLSQSAYPLDPSLESSFKDSDLLVEEVDMAEMLAPDAQVRILGRGMLPGTQSLDKVISPATLALVKKAVSDLGITIEPLQLLKPWMAAIALEGLELQRAGFDPQLGLDKHFFDLAHDSGKAVQGLETVDFQISKFDDMTMDQQDHMLAEILKELSTEEANVNKLVAAWKSGDTATLERIVLADLKSDPQMYQRLLVERNRNWLPKIDALFARKGHAMVIVGAAHLIGPDGLLAMLKAQGYTVEQL